MNRPSLRTVVTGAALSAALVTTQLSAPTASAGRHPASEAHLELVADGLDNPRHLTATGAGRLLVAEAGRGGGPGTCLPSGGLPVGSGLDELCFGRTGAIAEVRSGSVRRVVTGLPSAAGPTGDAATGPHDVAARGSRMHVLTGGYTVPLPGLELTQEFGKVIEARRHRERRIVADISAIESTSNPGGAEVLSNPYGMEALKGGDFVVVDAAGNDVLAADRGGEVRALTALGSPGLTPDPDGSGDVAYEPVPTSVAEGPDGALYVTELTGYPFPVGGARVLRLPPDGGAPTVFAAGFTNLVDLAFARDGSLYVLSVDEDGLLGQPPTGGEEGRTGALYRVQANGSVELVVREGLVSPAGVAVDRRGDVYVTNRSTIAGQGEVVRVIEPGR